MVRADMRAHVFRDVLPHLLDVVVAALKLRRTTPDVVDTDQEGLVVASVALAIALRR